MNIPKIKIQYNVFLDNIISEWIQLKGMYPDWTPPTKEEVIERAKKYKEYWNSKGSIYLEKMQEILGFEFDRAEIDIWVVGGIPRPFAHPVVISSRYTEDEFWGIVIHELIHVLIDSKKGYAKKIKALFDNSVQYKATHIPVYAVVQQIAEETGINKDIFKPEKNKGYIEAWEYVEQVGYKTVLDQILPFSKFE